MVLAHRCVCAAIGVDAPALAQAREEQRQRAEVAGSAARTEGWQEDFSRGTLGDASSLEYVMQPLGVRLGGNGGIDELRLCANPRSPAYVRVDDGVEPARICAASDTCRSGASEAPALEGAPPDPNVAPASARWLAATLPAAYVPPALLEELLAESLTHEAQSDALCGNTLAVLRLRRFPNSAPAALAFHPAGLNCSAVEVELVFQRAGGGVGVQSLAELQLGALPLRQLVLAPGDAGPVRLLATRRPYRTDFMTVSANQEALSAIRSGHASSTKQPVPVAMGSIGYAASRIRAAHVEWSPHVQGDAAVVSEDGSLQLFDVAAATGAHATQLRGLQVCVADGAPLGWRSCVFGANPRTLLCASAATVWLADARSPPPSTPRVVHLMAGGRPTAESFTALCSAEAAGSSFMFGAATSTRVLLFDSRRAHAPLLAWEHWLGADDPPRILSCQSAQPWMPAGSPDAGCFLLASNLGRREAAAFQLRSAKTPGAVDAIGWASELLRTRIGVHAISAGIRLPSVAARSAGDASSDTGNPSWNLSDPPVAGFALLAPDAAGKNSRGILSTYGTDGLAAVLCSHVPDDSEELFNADAFATAGPAGVVTDEAPPRQDKRALLDAALTSRTLPLHFSLLASSRTDRTRGAQPHPDPKLAVLAAQQSLWPVTLLEAAHSASMQMHGQTSSLRESAVLSAANASEVGATRKAGKALNQERRRAAVVPLLRDGREGSPIQALLPAPLASGTAPVLVASRKALLEAEQGYDGSRLLHARLRAQATAADDGGLVEQSHAMDATVLAPGAGALHCAAFRAAWATCSAWGTAWGTELPFDPSRDVFCPGELAAGDAGTLEPRLDLPPPPADADAAALQELARRWPERLEPAEAAGTQAAPGAAAPPEAAEGRPPGATKAKKRSRRDGF